MDDNRLLVEREAERAECRVRVRRDRIRELGELRVDVLEALRRVHTQLLAEGDVRAAAR